MESVISLIIPVHNNADSITEWTTKAIAELRATTRYYEILFVDAGSTDDTVPLLSSLLHEEPSLRLIQLSRHCGFDVAASAGMESAIGDYIAVGSIQTDPPEILLQAIERLQNGAHIVIGKSSEREKYPIYHRTLKKAFHWYSKKFLNLDLVPGATSLFGLSRTSLNSITRIKDHYRRLRTLLATIGFRREIMVYKPHGPHPRSTLLRNIEDAIDITISNSMHPLRLTSRFALSAAFLNIFYLFYVSIIYFTKDDVASGWTTLSFQHGIMFLFIFLILTVISEYTGRILEESRGRPLYFISDEKSSAIKIADPDRLNVSQDG